MVEMPVSRGSRTAGLIGLAVSLLGYAWLAAPAAPQARPAIPPPDQPALSAQDKTEIAEVLRLKAETGDRVWPGLAAADLPIILFNARYEFLVGMADPPAPWEVLDDQSIQGKPVARRPAVVFEADALRLPLRPAEPGHLGAIEPDDFLRRGLAAGV